MSKKYIKVPIKGMHCKSCELLIEEKLKEIPEIVEVEISYRAGEASVYYSGSAPAMHVIDKVLKDVGYSIGHAEKMPFWSRDKNEYATLGTALLVLVALYMLLKSFGLTNINLSPDLSSPSWGLIIVIGLVAGFSTCMALVGGLSLGLSSKFAENHPTASSAEKFRPHIFFVLGRIVSYAALGGVLGLIGKVFQFSATLNGFLSIAVGAVMLLMGLQLTNVFPRLNSFKLALPKSISRLFGIQKKEREYSHKNAFGLGALTFFLPCGFTQAMQLYAVSTGSFSAGALTLGLFALGTAPGLLSIGGLTSLVRGHFKTLFFKVAGLAVIAFSVFNLNNGFALASLNFSSSDGAQSQVVADPNVKLVNGVQEVRMTESNSGYSPNKFSIQKGVPVKWIIDAKAPFSCASSIIVPKLNIKKSLSAGENIIEFTATETGKIAFSCSMGMYTGVFNVYDETSGATTSTVQDSASPAVVPSSATCASGGGGCGCGGGNKLEKDKVETSSVVEGSEQLIKASYTDSSSLSPNSFKIKAGVRTRFEIDVKDDGFGCGYAIMIPGLYDEQEPLTAGRTITMEFTPEKGIYDITCGMQMIRFGSIIVE